MPLANKSGVTKTGLVSFSVAGHGGSLGQMWSFSSRGTSSDYSKGSPTQSPRMAHLVEQVGADPSATGISLASQRAAAESPADPAKPPHCTEGDKLLEQTYGSSALSNWNNRYGLTWRDK